MRRKTVLAGILPLTMASLLMACSDEAGSSNENEDNNETTEQQEVPAAESEDVDAEASMDAAEDAAEQPETKEDDALSEYSSEDIEYARVWRQLGANQEIEALYVRHISSGEPLNPDDETSAVYPEDVVQLSGARLVDGSVTYSSNGDGTINKYNVPLRWDGKNPAGREVYTEIIDNTKTIRINPGEDEEIIRLINLLQ
ncbi:hypothetical protein [Salibacterium halotolerans]|nr:hypothetical protein [Salibacterium halotolerans]